VNYHVNITVMKDKLEIKHHDHKQCKPVIKYHVNKILKIEKGCCVQLVCLANDFIIFSFIDSQRLLCSEYIVFLIYSLYLE